MDIYTSCIYLEKHTYINVYIMSLKGPETGNYEEIPFGPGRAPRDFELDWTAILDSFYKVGVLLKRSYGAPFKRVGG